MIDSKYWKKRNCQPRILYLAKLSFRNGETDCPKCTTADGVITRPLPYKKCYKDFFNWQQKDSN